MPIRAFAVLAGVAMLTAACGGGSSTGSTAAPSSSEPAATSSAPGASPTTSGPPVRGTADLVIWTDQLKAPAVKAVADKFATDNGITVAVQVVTGDLQAQFVTANAAGTAPTSSPARTTGSATSCRTARSTRCSSRRDQIGGYADVAVKARPTRASCTRCRTASRPSPSTATPPSRPTRRRPWTTRSRSAGQPSGAGKVDSAFNLQQGRQRRPVPHGAAVHLDGRLPVRQDTPTVTTTRKDLGSRQGRLDRGAKKIAALGEKGDNVLRRSISG